MSETSDTDAKPIPPLSEWEMLSALRIQLEVEIFQTNKVTLFSALERAGVTKIVITFDGYGDSGQIEDVQAKAGDDDSLQQRSGASLSRSDLPSPSPLPSKA